MIFWLKFFYHWLPVSTKISLWSSLTDLCSTKVKQSTKMRSSLTIPTLNEDQIFVQWGIVNEDLIFVDGFFRWIKVSQRRSQADLCWDGQPVRKKFKSKNHQKFLQNILGLIYLTSSNRLEKVNGVSALKYKIKDKKLRNIHSR